MKGFAGIMATMLAMGIGKGASAPAALPKGADNRGPIPPWIWRGERSRRRARRGR